MLPCLRRFVTRKRLHLVVDEHSQRKASRKLSVGAHAACRYEPYPEWKALAIIANLSRLCAFLTTSNSIGVRDIRTFPLLAPILVHKSGRDSNRGILACLSPRAGTLSTSYRSWRIGHRPGCFGGAVLLSFRVVSWSLFELYQRGCIRTQSTFVHNTLGTSHGGRSSTRAHASDGYPRDDIESPAAI